MDEGTAVEVTNVPSRNGAENIERLKPAHYYFAKLIAEGKTQHEAALLAFPQWRKWKRSSVDTEASRLCSNPKIQEQIELHSIGAHQLGESYLPTAVQVTADIMSDPSAKAADRLKAAADTKDRHGAPRNTKQTIDARTLNVSLLADISSTATPEAKQLQPTDTDQIPAQLVASSEVPDSNPPPSLPSPESQEEDLEQSRARWAQIASEES